LFDLEKISIISSGKKYKNIGIYIPDNSIEIINSRATYPLIIK